MSNTETAIWKFIRKDLPAADFEQWVYEHAELEDFFGKDFYLGVISSGFVQEQHIYELRESLRDWMATHTTPSCDCVRWESRQVLLEVGEGFFDEQEYLSSKFEIIKKQAERRDLIACRACRQKWFLAVDEIIFNYHLLRLSEEQVEKILNDNQWPTDFDDLNTYPDNYLPQ